MTIKDVRAFAKVFTDWCLAQDDLAGFQIDLGDQSLHVILDWPGGWCRTLGLTLDEARRVPSTALVLALDGIARTVRAEACRQDLPVAD